MTRERFATARVMEKAEMTREVVFRRYHITPNISSEPRDCIVCAKARCRIPNLSSLFSNTCIYA